MLAGPHDLRGLGSTVGVRTGFRFGLGGLVRDWMIPYVYEGPHKVISTSMCV